MAKTNQKNVKPKKANPKLVRFEDDEFDDDWGSKPPVETEKTRKLQSMFLFFLMDISWKLALSFLVPFFIALAFSGGKTIIVVFGIVAGIAFSSLTIALEVKKINKALENV